jgi:hypothetical protein
LRNDRSLSVYDTEFGVGASNVYAYCKFFHVTAIKRYGLVCTAGCGTVVINSLAFQNAFYQEGKQSQICKAKGAYDKGLMNTYDIGEFSLYGRNNGTSQDHHDQKG